MFEDSIDQTLTNIIADWLIAENLPFKVTFAFLCRLTNDHPVGWVGQEIVTLWARDWLIASKLEWDNDMHQDINYNASDPQFFDKLKAHLLNDDLILK